jgi:GAF domain-containing protein
VSAEAPASLVALGEATRAACGAAGPEEALREITRRCPGLLGDRDAHLREGALKAGERQFSVCGAFMLTPDGKQNLLVADVGFPAEQHRLRIDAGLGHPGWVVQHRRPLLLANTDLDPNFRQILKTSRMGSALYAPMIWKEQFVGQIVLASQARGTYAQADLDILVTFAGVATALWRAHDGPAWLATLG